MTKYVIFFLLLIGNRSSAQQLSYIDPATAYLRIMLEKGSSGMQQQIGNFKVQGTSYLFGQLIRGHVYSPTQKAENIQMSYNTYNQQLEIYQDNSGIPLIKTVNEIDSFSFIATSSSDFKENLYFVSSVLLDSSKKLFLQEVAKGPRFSLYKSYRSTLGYVSTNYIQSDLRQFDLKYEYYYRDATKPGLKKLKITSNVLKKEFKDIADISPFLEDNTINTNPEVVLRMIFGVLNSK